jgi:DNA-binding CsgD family transcriptional regulator
LAEVLKIEDAASGALSTGLAYQADGCIEVHPLARDFLRSKLKERGDSEAVARAAYEHAVAKGNFDHAFRLARDFVFDDQLEDLITRAYPDLLASGRIATLEDFGRYGATRGVANSLTDLIAAEAALLRSEFIQARSLGSAAADSFPDRHPLKARGLLISGHAAHFLYQFEDAYDYHSRAAKEALRIEDVNDAAWGKCIVGFALEDERMSQSVRELEGLRTPRVTDRVRLDTARRHLAIMGAASGLRGDRAEGESLLSEITDPWVRSGWRYRWGYSLVLEARYQEARRVLLSVLRELDEFGLQFGVPHVQWTLAAAELGLRHFAQCDRRLRRVESHSNYSSDLYVQLNVRALRARLYLAQHRPDDAIRVTLDDFPAYPMRAMYGEYLATRAVALAVSGESRKALAASEDAVNVTTSVDTHLLCAGARAIAFPTEEAAVALSRDASRLGVWDPLVCCLRASVTLLSQMVAAPTYRAELRDVLIRANDQRLAKSVRLITRSTGSGSALTNREREIIDQLNQGRKNTEIAASLFLSPATVKSHLDHIYVKLGVRSRAQAVARYAEIEKADTDESSDS